MSPVDAYGPSAWLSWAKGKSGLTMHHGFIDKQTLKITQELVGQFRATGIIESACQIFENTARSNLGEAISRAVYWYSEAHRESVPVMKLVKYWSAVETFFSTNQTDITKSVSAGLTAVLVFGGCGFIPASEYFNTKRRVAALYSARSRAVHRASHRHVSQLDAAELSQWTAWMLINMIYFHANGYITVDQIKQQADRLDARMCEKGSAGMK